MFYAYINHKNLYKQLLINFLIKNIFLATKVNFTKWLSNISAIAVYECISYS